MCQVLYKTNFPCISTSNSPCECTKKLHQTLPVNVRKNYISFFRKRCHARYSRPSAGLRARRARRVGIKNPQSFFNPHQTWSKYLAFERLKLLKSKSNPSKNVDFLSVVNFLASVIFLISL